jgi:dTDP-glucose 4,6-dehydratase
MKKTTYFITGGCGFIGSHIIDVLLDSFENILIINIDKLGVGSDINNVRKDSRVINHYVDICDEKIFSIFKEYTPDYVIHCAAESHVDRSISDPIAFVDSNVKGTANILECVRRFAPSARMVHVSTDEVYGHLHQDDPPFTELSQIDPRSPYSASKAGSDMLAFSYRNTYNLDITVTRCCNNYGPRQHSEKLIPTIIRSIVEGKQVPVYGDGQNIREWIYVTDHAHALIEILHKQSARRLYNIYGVTTISNLVIIDTIINALVKLYPQYKRDSKESYIKFVKDRDGHDFKYAMSSIYDEVDSLKRQNNFNEGIITTLLYYMS